MKRTALVVALGVVRRGIALLGDPESKPSEPSEDDDDRGGPERT